MQNDTIQLPGSPIKTTRVGFGCSNLLGDKTKEVGLSLLHAAYDAGVLHYDVARVYNFGDAEALVGDFASGRRDKITITSKFGLMPNAGLAKMKGPVQLVRRIMRSSSFIRKLVRRNVKSVIQAAQFDPITAQRSLEDSLRALRTDYIDIYLLHEATVTDCTDEIYDFLQRSKAAGKILSFGCGSGYEKVPPIASTRPDFLPVAQFESSLTAPNMELFRSIRPPQNLLTSTHGAMNAASAVRTYLSSAPSKAKEWSATLGVDLQKDANLYGLLLRQALTENPDGLVLFRASTPERIQATINAANSLTLTPDQSEAWKAVGREATQLVPAHT